MATRKLRPEPGHGSLAQQAYERIRAGILRGDLPLGCLLSRRNLADQLGMSFLPVTDALQRLESDGLVESRPRIGTWVRVPTEQDIRGHYVVREALETQSARLYSEKASPIERKELAEMAAKLDAMYATVGKDMFETFSAHERLHRRVAECTGCPVLVNAIEKSHVLILNWHYNSVSHYRELPLRWHTDLIRALNSGDPEKADRKMREHVRFGMEEVLRRLEASLGLGSAATPFGRSVEAAGGLAGVSRRKR